MKLLRIIIAFTLLGSTTHAWARFSDIENSWYRESILKLTGESIIQGYGDGTFGPEKTITRAEILKIILMASGNGVGEVPLDRCFPDVDQKMWYHAFICRAYALRVTNGFSDGTFKPNAPVTTLEALAFSFRAFGIATPVTGSGQSWHDPVRILADEKNILDKGSYSLDTPISRGRATELISRVREYKQTGKSISTRSLGCSVGKDLSTKNTLMIAGKTREYLLEVPKSYRKDRIYPLIVAVHGRTNSKEQVKNYMGLENTDDFIVAYPAGLDASGGARSWGEAENIMFFDALIREVSESYCIDRSDIFVVGHSLGGWFTQKLACLRGDVIRATASVGSAGYSGLCTGPTTALIYQNKDDALSSYASGKAGLEIRKSTNSCSGDPVKKKIGSRECLEWSSCSDENTVIWCEGYDTLGNDPHSWPVGGGRDILEWISKMKNE